VLALRYWLDLSTDEVAQVVGVSPQAVRNLQYRGLQSLRASLAERPDPAPLPT
jgi:DNA-directed RNA polymerase specialized sigma24 family protein